MLSEPKVQQKGIEKYWFKYLIFLKYIDAYIEDISIAFSFNTSLWI